MEKSEFLKAKIKALIAESKYEESEDYEEDDEEEEDEDEDEMKEQANGEAEGGMVKAQLKSIIADAQKLHDSIGEGEDLPAWVQNKITLAHHNVEAATEYMTSDIQEQRVRILEKINMKKAKMGDVIKDFYKSKAPQFKGRSKAKRRQMAVAAKLSAMRGPMKGGMK